MRIDQSLLIRHLLLATIISNCHSITIHKYAPEFDKPTDYSFSYGVKDIHTGDVKHQWEKKEGETIKGQYSMMEADGSVRTVHYTADDKNGFNAIVKKSGPLQHILPDSKHALSHNDVELKHQHYLEPDDGRNNNYEYDFAKDVDDVEEDKAGATDEEAPEGYIYLTPEPVGAATQESQRITLKSEYKRSKPLISVKDEYEDVKFLPRLPVDLDLLHKNPLEKIVPLEIENIKPVEVQIKKGEVYENHQKTSAKDTGMTPSHELSHEELNKYLSDYYSTSNSNNDIRESSIETGFKPIRPKAKNPITQPMIPNTFKSNKKPATTAGWGHYSTKTGNAAYRFSSRIPKTNYGYPYWPALKQGDQRNAELTRLYRSTSNNGYTRYAKRVRYEEI